jgi:hypothetical protein
MCGEGLADLSDRGLEVGAVVVDRGRREEDAAVEVGEEEPGAGLGAVDADNADMVGANLLHARVEHATRLGDGSPRTTRRRAFPGTGSGHGTSIRKKGWK